ncbi:DUF4320 family protein [Paenibacillus alvei]|uniref:DUF4320 family protein n=1 Tax=Paenibacillus alvei TaxID=44250 RepID=UPI00227F8911|nr:DUF4320 family protein [Paenibacillus alvei]
MKLKLHAFMKEEKGDWVVIVPFAILITLIFFLIAVTIYQRSAIQGNLQTAANEVIQDMKMQSGADSTTRAKFDDLLVRMGMDPNKVKFEATPQTVQRGGPLEVKASQDYNVFALKAIGVNYTVKITATATGLAHKFIR